MTAAARLDAALEVMAERGVRPPCSYDTDRLWFGSTSTERAEAARLCRTRCPIVAECRAAADELPAAWRMGVWGGEDFTPVKVRPSHRGQVSGPPPADENTIWLDLEEAL